jgi:hypothetical protein
MEREGTAVLDLLFVEVIGMFNELYEDVLFWKRKVKRKGKWEIYKSTNSLTLIPKKQKVKRSSEFRLYIAHIKLLTYRVLTHRVDE